MKRYGDKLRRNAIKRAKGHELSLELHGQSVAVIGGELTEIGTGRGFSDTVGNDACHSKNGAVQLMAHTFYLFHDPEKTISHRSCSHSFKTASTPEGAVVYQKIKATNLPEHEIHLTSKGKKSFEAQSPLPIAFLPPFSQAGEAGGHAPDITIPRPTQHSSKTPKNYLPFDTRSARRLLHSLGVTIAPAKPYCVADHVQQMLESMHSPLPDNAPLVDPSRRVRLLQQCKARLQERAEEQLALRKEEELPAASPPTCKLCDNKVFSSKASLRQHHQAVHLGLARFPCQFCDKRFTQNAHRIDHERLHTGEKPYSCENCPAAFTHYLGLANHNLKVHGQRTTKKEAARVLQGLGKSQGKKLAGEGKGGRQEDSFLASSLKSSNVPAAVNSHTHSGDSAGAAPEPSELLDESKEAEVTVVQPGSVGSEESSKLITAAADLLLTLDSKEYESLAAAAWSPRSDP